MDTAIKHHFNQQINERVRLTGGYTFETWLLTLSDKQKVVFRTQTDFVTGGGRKIIIADIFKREKFFYDNVNEKIGHICPNVYIVDDTLKYYDKSYQISEYIEGTPLNLCIDSFDKQTKNNVYYKIGEIAAQINNLEINENHLYVKRSSWEDFIADRLYERLSALLKNNVITIPEIDKITNNLRRKKADKTLSYLHLDMRPINMIYNEGNIFILDAENCEFGDNLFELAGMDLTGILTQPLLDGYKSTTNVNIDIGNDLFYYYKMERTALVFDVYCNEVKSDTISTQYYLAKFNELKKKLLKF